MRSLRCALRTSETLQRVYALARCASSIADALSEGVQAADAADSKHLGFDPSRLFEWGLPASMSEPAAGNNGLSSDSSTSQDSSCSSSQISLRPYQQEALAAVLDKARDSITRQLVCLPTGSGKTVIFAELARVLNCRTLVLVHRGEILRQAIDRFRQVWPGVDIGILQGATKQLDAQVVVAMVQSASRLPTLEQLQAQRFELVIIDEAHRAEAASYKKIAAVLGFLEADKGSRSARSSSSSSNSSSDSGSDDESDDDGGAWAGGGEAADDRPAALPRLLVGFTATPRRGDGKSLASVFQLITFHLSTSHMVAEGHLVRPFGERVPTEADLTDVLVRAGDYALDQLTVLVNTPERNHHIVRSYLEKAPGRKALAFCCDVQHAKDLAAAFEEAGVACGCVHGKMGDAERAAVLRDFAAGRYQVVTNCMILTEGYDESSISCILMARPTRSQALYIQCVGRGLRLHEGKEDCLVLDFTDKCHDLKMPVTLGDVYKEPAYPSRAPSRGSSYGGQGQGAARKMRAGVQGGALDLLPQDGSQPPVEAGVAGGSQLDFGLLDEAHRISSFAWQAYGPHLFLSIERDRTLWLLQGVHPLQEPPRTPRGDTLQQQLEELKLQELKRKVPLPRFWLHALSHSDWAWHPFTALRLDERYLWSDPDWISGNAFLAKCGVQSSLSLSARQAWFAARYDPIREMVPSTRKCERSRADGKYASLQRSAPWRRETASERQLALLRRLGHEPAAEGLLSKGAASDLICWLKLRRAHEQGRLSFPPGFETEVL